MLVSSVCYRPNRRATQVSPRSTVKRTAAGLALFGLFAPLAFALDYTHLFGPSAGTVLDFTVGQGAARYGFTTGDALIARINARGSIGGIAGSRNAVVIPEFLFFPEIRADTRTGLKLSLALDAYAGLEISGGFDLGGGDISGSYAIGPQLSLPSQVRAGEFFQMRGETFIGGANLDLNVGLPSFDLGMDVVLGGSAGGSIEYGLFPFVPYNIGAFNLNLPDIRLPILNLGLDFNLPGLPSFSFLDIPNLIPPSQQDDALFRKKLPGIDPLNPGGPGPLLSAGEVVLVNPAKSASVSAPVVEDGAIVTRTTGDLIRLGLDLDGIATFAATGVSFTGLEIDIKPGSVSLAKLGYDLIDVKYGLEIGYELENRVDTFFEVDLSFVDPTTGEAVEVLLRDAGSVTFGNSYSGRFDRLPDVALLGSNDVEMRVDFTGLKRTLNQKGSLTLSDYMEIKALAARASLLGGVASIELGPLFYQKFELAGQFAALDVYDVSLTLSDLGLFDSLFDGRVLIDAIPTLDAYLDGAAPGAQLFGTLEPSQFTLLESHQTATGMQSADIVYAIGGGDATTRARHEMRAASYHLDASVDLQLGGLHLPVGAELIAGTVSPIAATLRVNGIENHGLISAIAPGASQSSVLNLGSVDPDGALLLSGDGEIRIGANGVFNAAILVNGAGHTITFDDDTPGPAVGEGFRAVIAGQAFTNQGTVRARGDRLSIFTQQFENTPAGVLSAEDGAIIGLLRSPSGLEQGGALINTGLIEASGAGSTIGIALPDIAGVFVAPGTETTGRGLWRAGDGGRIELFEAKALGGARLSLSSALEFIAMAGGEIVFNDTIDLAGDVRLIAEAGGTLRLNGLERRFADSAIDIVNHGLLDLVSGITSLRPQGPSCPGCPPPAPVIRPIDLVNTGTVRVHAGAGFAFDVDIVDYAEGGASLNSGTWELFGARKRFNNDTAVSISEQRSDLAVIDVRVSEVFGNATKFADLAFDEVLDPDTGEVVSVTSTISALDTRLVYNDATVRLHGAAHFGYFNTVGVNRGELELAHLHQFFTAGHYENRGGLTRIDEDAGLHVNGALFINGGEVRIGEHDSFASNGRWSELSVHGAAVEQADGTFADRDVEINGGTLYLGQYANLNSAQGSLFGASGAGGFTLRSDRSWVVRDVVSDDGFGNETVTPGAVVLETRGGLLASGNPHTGVAEIHENHAEVLIEGTAAHFGGLEYLTLNTGSLTLAGGTYFERAGSAVIAGNTLTNAAGALIRVEGAQLTFAGAGSRLVNAGRLDVRENAYLEVTRIDKGTGNAARIDVAGVLNVADGIATRRLVVTDGAVITPQIGLDGGNGANGTLLAPTGVAGQAGGLMELGGGTISSAALSARGGNGGRGSTLLLGADGSDGGAGGAGGTIAITGGQLVADAVIDLRGGAGGNGTNGVVITLFAGAGGDAGNGGAGGDIHLDGGELVLNGGMVDLRGGAGGSRGLGATNIFGGRGADGRNGAQGADGRLSVSGGTLTASAQTLDTAVQGEIVYSHGTLRFTDDLFDLDHSSTQLNALLGAQGKALAGGQALAFDQVLRIGAGSELTLAGGTLAADALELDAAASLAFFDGVLDVGTVHGSLVQQGGTLAPGNSLGLTTITGDYTIEDGTLAIELAGLARGGTYDAVDVGGTATLGGTLAISLIEDFLPNNGDLFQLLAAETIVGSFDLLMLAMLPDHLIWDLAYLLDPFGTDFVMLRAAPVPLPPAVLLLVAPLCFVLRRRPMRA